MVLNLKSLQASDMQMLLDPAAFLLVLTDAMPVTSLTVQKQFTEYGTISDEANSPSSNSWFIYVYELVSSPCESNLVASGHVSSMGIWPPAECPIQSRSAWDGGGKLSAAGCHGRWKKLVRRRSSSVGPFHC